MTFEQIESEFQRQIRLCSGIGAEDQLRLVARFWNGTIKRTGDGQGYDYEINVKERNSFDLTGCDDATP